MNNQPRIDVKEILDEHLPIILKMNAQFARRIGTTYQLNLTGEGGGHWFLDLSDSGPSARRGVGDPECTITMTTADFMVLYEDPGERGISLFFAGLLRVEGNQILAVKLEPLFDLHKKFLKEYLHA